MDLALDHEQPILFVTRSQNAAEWAALKGFWNEGEQKAIDPATGELTADVPLDVMQTLSILFTLSDGTTTHSDTVDAAFDGNAEATVTYVPTADFWGEDPLSYTLTDDAEGPSTGTVILDVASRLDPPLAVTDRFEVDEDSFIILTPADLLANDIDVDGDPIRFLSVQDGINGTVTFDGTDIRFTPAADFSGKASFTYTVTDDTHGESTGDVEITVRSTNTAPEAVTDVFATVEDTPFEFSIADLLDNDTDIDGDTLSFVSIQSSIADARIIELPDGRYQFVPDENIFGERSFSYSITDGRLTDRGTITFDIAAVNDAPIANPDGHFHGDQDTPLVIDFADLIFNDRDVEGDAFQIVDVFDGDNGTVTRDGDTAVFLGREGYFGDGGFHYRVTDEHGATSTGYATVLIFPEFDVPVAVSDAGFEMLEDTFLDIDPDQLLANDEIPLGSDVTFLGLTGPGVEELDNGLYRITPDPDFFGTLILEYRITNEIGFEVPASVTIEVLPVSDAPVAVDDRFFLVEDQPLVIFTSDLTGNDYDVDRQAFTLTRIFDAVGVTVQDLGDGQFLITPDENFTGIAGFDYEIKDTTGIAAQAHVTVALEAANDAPVIADPGVLMGLEDEPLSIALGDLVTDADSDALVVELRGPGGLAMPAWLNFDAETRVLSGTPPQDFNGEILMELFATDGIEDALRALTLNIVPVNDAPVITSDAGAATALHTIFENSTGVSTVTAMDVDGDPLGFAITGGADATLFAIDPTTGELTFVAPPDFEAPTDAGGDNLYDVTVAVSDGLAMAEQQISVAVLNVNETPVIADPGPLTGEEDQPLVIDLSGLITDPEDDPLQVALTGDGAAALPGWMSFDSETQILTGTPPQDFNGEILLELSASDGAKSALRDLVLTLTPVNDAPVFTSGDALDVAENTTLVATITAEDVDGDALQYAIAGGADAALFTIDTTSGALAFLSAPDFEAPTDADGDNAYEVTVSVTDGEEVVAQQITATVQNVNEAPVITSDGGEATAALSVTENTTGVTTVAAQDVDGDPLSYAIAGGADAALFTIDPTTGALVFNAAPDFEAPADADGDNIYDVTVEVSDGAITDSQAISVTVTDVNEAPIISDPGPLSTLEDQAISLSLAGLVSDPDGDTLTVTLRGVAASALPGWMAFDPDTLVASGTPPQDFNGEIQLELTATDGIEEVLRALTLTIQPVNDAPVITSDGGEATAALTVAENTTDVTTVTAGDVDGDALTYAITGGADAALFTIDPTTGALAFLAAPDFEAPADADGDNIYDVTVEVTDGTATDSQAISVTVTDVDDTSHEVVETDDDGSQPWASRTRTYDAEGNLVAEQVVYDDDRVRTSQYEDGQRVSDSWVDVAGRYGWAEQTRTYDAEGNLQQNRLINNDGLIYDTHYEDGVRQSKTYEDVNDLRTWDTMSESYDADGLIESRTITYDDGREAVLTFTGAVIRSQAYPDRGGGGMTEMVRYDYGNTLVRNIIDGVVRSERGIDGADVFDWKYTTALYDETGVIEQEVVENDDGSVVTTLYTDGVRQTMEMADPDDWMPWQSIVETYDAAGMLTTRTTVYDDGREQDAQYDAGVIESVDLADLSDEFVWTTQTATYDAGEVTSQQTVFDDGITATSDFVDGVIRTLLEEDTGDIVDWLTRTTTYDEAGVATQRVTEFDDGSTDTLIY